MTAALDNLKTILQDVDNLLSHHPKATAPTRGRPESDEGPLNRSCVVLAYAAWEVYAEDSLVWVAERLASVPAPEDLPDATRAFIAAQVSDPWKMTGEGWRTVLVDGVQRLVQGDPEDETSFGVNTAGPRQIAALHSKVIGVRLLDRCSWSRNDNDKVKRDLAHLVRERGSIVHTGKPLGTLHLARVRQWRNWIETIASSLDREITTWLGDEGVPL